MILIITINVDVITSNIAAWLLHYKKAFRIISSEDTIRIIKINTDSIIIKNYTRNYELDFSKLEILLYRQGDIILDRIINSIDDKNLLNYCDLENLTIKEYIYSKLYNIKHLGHPNFGNLNKLIILNKALRFNLKIPEYLLTTDKSELKTFLNKHNVVITKTILPYFSYEKDKHKFLSYTEILNKADLINLNQIFHPTFFQKLIYKKFDVRTFYLKGKFYSIAIFSQKNTRTKTDCRNYDKTLPNKEVPFKLPKNIRYNLKKLMLDLKLSYGSIDLIYGIDKNFYFLEINPIGQFGNVSYFGNYYLEKKMAKSLIK